MLLWANWTSQQFPKLSIIQVRVLLGAPKFYGYRTDKSS